MERITSGDKAKMPMTERFYSVNGQMMGYESGGVKKDFLTDHLGSITAEIDQNQNRTFETRYSAYGRNNWSTGTGCGFGWVGSYGYRETGLFHMSHYVRARHYSYLTGAWSTVDPLWPQESAYGYVGGRGSAFVDPSGQQFRLGVDPWNDYQESWRCWWERVTTPPKVEIEIVIPPTYGLYCGPQTTKDQVVIVRGKPVQRRGISSTDECCRVHDSCFKEKKCTAWNQLFDPECAKCTRTLCSCFKENQPSIFDVLYGNATWEEYYWNREFQYIYCRWPFTGL
jgi:RHS repeat-associated protein